MRILIVAIGTYGDVLPFIGLASELDRRGHEVTLACAETFMPAARRAGVEVEPLTSAAEYSALFEHPQFWRPFLGARRLFKNLHTFLKSTHDFVVRHHREGDTLVIASALAIGTRIANETHRVPVVSVHLTPIMFVSRDAPPRMPFQPMPGWLPPAMKLKIQTGLYTAFIAPLIKPGLNAFRLSLGLKPRKKIRSWWHSSQRMLLLFPDWFAPRQADWPSQSVQLGFPRADMFGAASAGLDPKLEAFLNAGEPPVAITFGSARLRTASLYKAAIEACAKTGRRCLVLSHQTIKPPKGYEDRAFFSTYAPLGQVLPRCAALIHHGGVGTVSQAFAAGVPQIVAPMAFDQFDHAARVRRLGCGTSVPRELFAAGRVAKTLDALLSSPSVAEACRDAAARSDAGDVLADACDRIEAEFGTARPGVYSPREAAE